MTTSTAHSCVCVACDELVPVLLVLCMRGSEAERYDLRMCAGGGTIKVLCHPL